MYTASINTLIKQKKIEPEEIEKLISDETDIALLLDLLNINNKYEFECAKFVVNKFAIHYTDKFKKYIETSNKLYYISRMLNDRSIDHKIIAKILMEYIDPILKKAQKIYVQKQNSYLNHILKDKKILSHDEFEEFVTGNFFDKNYKLTVDAFIINTPDNYWEEGIHYILQMSLQRRLNAEQYLKQHLGSDLAEYIKYITIDESLCFDSEDGNHVFINFGKQRLELGSPDVWREINKRLEILFSPIKFETKIFLDSIFKL